MEKEIEINEKKYTIKEITYVQALEFDGLSKAEMGKSLLKFSVGLTDEEINKLSIKEGIELQKQVNEVNNLTDFQEPTEKEE